MITDLLFRVLASTAVGFASGWLIRSVFVAAQSRRVERSWTRQLETGKVELEAAARRADALESANRRLEARNRELEESFDTLNAELELIRTSFANREKSITELRDALLQARKNLQDNDRLRIALAAREKQLEELKGVRSELLQRALHQPETKSLKAELRSVNEHVTTLAAENTQLRQQRMKLDESLTLARERIDSLEIALEGARAQVPPSPPDSAEAIVQIARLEGRLKDRNEAVAEMRADLDRLTQSYQGRIRDLERQLGNRARENISSLIDAEEPPTVTREAPPAGLDDMTEISGIGPVLQQALRSAGILSYHQLARLTPEELERYSPQLSPFKARIMRENWIGQAQRLHQQKYGSAGNADS